MKIEIASLRLVGCGPFDDVTLNFCDKDDKPKKTILLAGANGSGKTTALETIFRTFSFEFHLQMENFRPSDKGYSILEFHMDDERRKLKYGQKPNEISLNQDFLLEKTVSVFQKMRETPFITPTHLCPPSLIYFPHPRMLKPVGTDFLHSEEFAYTPAYKYKDSDIFPGSLSSYLVWLEYSDNEEFIKIINFLNDLEINKKKFNIIRKKLQAFVQTPEGANHPIEEMSSGEQNLFILLLELRRRITKGSILMIDEVEGSLHPAYQYKLIYALEKIQEEFDFQLIMSTHSVDILDAVGPGNTLFLTDYSDLKVELMK